MTTKLMALIFGVLGASASNVFAGETQITDTQEYSYSTKLDIAEVTMSPDLNFCGVRPVVMSYIDHMGKPHSLRYEASGNGCLGQN